MAAAAQLAIIDNLYLWKHQDGLVLPFEKEAGRTPKTTGANIVTARMTRYAEAGDRIVEARQIIAAPQVIAQLDELEDGPDITSDGIIIKRKNSTDIGLPSCFGFAASMAKTVGQDVLETYGLEIFKGSVIRFVAQRTEVSEGQAHRQSFAGWHDHLENNARIDLIYGFADEMPTEYKIGQEIIAQPRLSLTRFGSEIKHRSPSNESGSKRRTWGAFIVEPHSSSFEAAYNTGAPNAALDSSSKRALFIDAAREILTRQQSHITRRQPGILIEELALVAA